MKRLMTLAAGAMLMAALGCASSCPFSRNRVCAPVSTGCAPVTDGCGNMVGGSMAPMITGPTTPGIITPTPEYYTPSPR